MHWVNSRDLQVIASDAALNVLQNKFSDASFNQLKIGDLVCATCRRDGSRAIAAFSPTAISVQSPRDLTAAQATEQNKMTVIMTQTKHRTLLAITTQGFSRLQC
jgi:hypothetical protein